MCIVGSNLLIQLKEPISNNAFDPIVTLSVEVNQTRSIDLVLGHTYHILCIDTDTRNFADRDRNTWYRNEVPVQKYFHGSIPESTVATVYASTDISTISSEWTLVLQRFRGEDVGVYSCYGTPGEMVSLSIGQSKYYINKTLTFNLHFVLWPIHIP